MKFQELCEIRDKRVQMAETFRDYEVSTLYEFSQFLAPFLFFIVITENSYLKTLLSKSPVSRLSTQENSEVKKKFARLGYS